MSNKKVRAAQEYCVSKKSSLPVTGLLNKGPLKVLKDTIVPKWLRGSSSRHVQNHSKSPILQTSNCKGNWLGSPVFVWTL